MRSPFGSVVAKGCNGTGPENFLDLALSGSLEAVKERSHVDLLSLEGIFLASGREQRSKAVNLINFVFLDNGVKLLSVKHIQSLMNLHLKRRRRPTQIRAYDILERCSERQRADEFLADLSIGSSKKNLHLL